MSGPSMRAAFTGAALHQNPAWAQLLGLCPLLAVSNSTVNALGLTAASAFVLLGSAGVISALRHRIPAFARLPVFVLVIGTFTTAAVMMMQAYAYALYLQVALFVQIIVTNCMILGRIEAFASRQGVGAALADAAGAAAGFALALLALGTVREVLGRGTLLAGMERLFGPAAAAWRIDVVPHDLAVLLFSEPPGAFIAAGLLLGVARALIRRRRRNARTDRGTNEPT